MFVTDLEAYRATGEIRAEYFPLEGPAPTMVEVSKLVTPELLVEIEAVVAI